MDTNQPPTFSTPNIPPSSPGIFGSKIPSAATFAVGILLFLLPFAEVKCNGSSFASNTGLGIVTGKEWKTVAGAFGNDLTDGTSTKTDGNQKNDPNVYAIIALALGVIGLILSLTNARSAIGSAFVSGILSAGALIGLMFDLKKKVKDPIPGGKTGGELDNTLNNIKVTLEFTPWFYIAVAAFLVAAFFCYKGMQSANR